MMAIDGDEESQYRPLSNKRFSLPYYKNREYASFTFVLKWSDLWISGCCQTFFPVKVLINILTTAIRNLLRQKANTAISLTGLTLGLTCSFILFLIIIHGNSFDTYHHHRDRIFRIVTQSKGNNGLAILKVCPFRLPRQ